jgi:lysophospholipase L1-like esterase
MRRTLFLVGSLAAILVILEIGLRVGLGLGSPPLLRADSTVGYVFQSNQDLHRFTNRVHINKYHQRSEPLLSRPDSTFMRLLFLGDSVTWGGVLTDQSDTIPEEVERQLAQHCSLPVEALNASAGSWGVGNLEAYVEEHGLFDSDVVVIQIGTHDLTQSKSTSEVVGRNPSYPNENPTLAMNELMVRYLWPRLRPYLPQIRGEEKAEGDGSNTRPEPEDRLERNLAYLRTLVGKIQEEEIPVMILHTPNRNEVSGEGSTSGASSYRRRFLRVVDSLQVPVLNLARGWRGRTNVRRLYRDFVHLNERGNAVTADTLSAMLREHVDTLCVSSAR